MIPPAACSHRARRVPALAQAGSLFGHAADDYWRDIGTPESYLQAHFDILEGAVDTAVGEQIGPDYLYVSPRRAWRPRRASCPPPTSTRGRWWAPSPGRAAGRRGRRLRSRRRRHVAESVLQEGVIVAEDARSMHSVLRARQLGRCRQRAGPRHPRRGLPCRAPATGSQRASACAAGYRAAGQQRRSSATGAERGGQMSIAPASSRRTTCAGCTRSEIDAGVAARIGAALVEQLGAGTVAVGRDPRLSSPELRRGLAAGAAAAGAASSTSVMVPTEMLYYGVADRGLDGGAMVTASHNPSQYNGMKLVGKGALPLSGDAGMPELERTRAAHGRSCRPSGGAPAGRRSWTSIPAYVSTCSASRSVHVAVLPRRHGRLQRHRRQARRRSSSRARRCAARAVLRRRRQLPQPRAQPAAGREPRAVAPSACATRRPTWASPGTAMPTAASSSTRPASSCPATSSRRCSPRRCWSAPGRRHPLRPARQPCVPNTRANGGVPLINRVGHAFFKQRMRREPVLFGGEVSGHYYFTENYNADSGFIPALLMLELLAGTGPPWPSCWSRCARATSSPARSTPRCRTAAVFRRLEERFADGRSRTGRRLGRLPDLRTAAAYQAAGH